MPHVGEFPRLLKITTEKISREVWNSEVEAGQEALPAQFCPLPYPFAIILP